jgi:hypothetical protein
LFTFGLLLAACKAPAPATPTATSLDPNAVFTAAAQTAEAVMTQSSITSPRTRIKIEYFLDVFNIAPPLRSSFLSITDKKCRQK